MIVYYHKVFYVKDSPIINDMLLYKKGDLEELRVITIRFCCDKMLSTWSKESRHHKQVHPPRIGFGEKIDTIGRNNDGTPHGIKTPEVFMRVEGHYNEDNVALAYCPFCGQPIEVSEIVPTFKNKLYTPSIEFST